VELIGQFLEEFTYLGVLLVLVVAGLGVPIPEELVVLAGGVLAHEGVVRWWLMLPLCVFGVLAGDVALYWVGRHWGERVLAWRAVRLVLSPDREEALKSGYRRHGVRIVFAARHVTGLRAAAFLTAGIAHVPFGRFLAADSAAALIGVPVTFGLAFFFAAQLHQVQAGVHRVERWALVLALMAAAAWFGFRAYRRRLALAREARAGRGDAEC
jgi:membrane protein DedA with SNARE-associated domain